MKTWLIVSSFLITILQLIPLLCPGWLIFHTGTSKISMSILYFTMCPDGADGGCTNKPFTDSIILNILHNTSADPAITFWIAAMDCIFAVLAILILLGDVIGNRIYDRNSYCEEKGIASLFLTSGTLSLVLLALFAHANVQLEADRFGTEPPFMLFVVGLQVLLSFLEGGYIILVWRLDRHLQYERAPSGGDIEERDTQINPEPGPSNRQPNGAGRQGPNRQAANERQRNMPA